MAEQRVNILIYKPDGTLIAQYLLGDGEHLIGRDINCPVYLDSEYISANHSKLHLGADGIYIEDLNSTSGTFLNGVTVRGKLRVKPGQVLQVGDLTIDLQPESTENIGPGSRLADGRYTLIRLLGRGGMGEVWLAKDEQLEEEVALKKLPPEVGADAMALADMRREVQKSRILSHPNVIRIHDLYAKSGEDPLITLEYVDGTDLTAIAATKTNGIFNWAEIEPLILQLCSALEFAHEQKIVHRDLKPANLMVSRKSEVKLADFGIAATMADSLSRSSMQGFISGTTLYMSPQQMEGESPRASDDIYAFGSTLYELLTSRPPFYTGDVQHQVLEVIPKPMDQRLAEFGFTNDIPEHIHQLVMSCLAKEPEGRPKDMAAIIQWIKSKGKEKGAVPKHTTKTVRRSRTANSLSKPELSPAKKGAKIAAMVGAVALAIGLGIWAKNQITELGSVQQQAQSSSPAKTKENGEESALTNNPATQTTNSSGGTNPPDINTGANTFNPRPEPVVKPIKPKEPQIIKVPPLAVTTPVTPASLKQGLIAYFPFDDGNFTDRSGKGHIPKMFARDSYSARSRHGPGFIPVADRFHSRKGALFTDGLDDGFIVPSLNLTNQPVSFAVWIFPVPLPKSQDAHRVIFDGFEKGVTQGIRLEIIDGKMTAYVGNKDEAIGRVNGNEHVTFNQWHHIACVHDGKNIYLYQNGKETGRDSAAGLPVLGSIRVGTNGSLPFLPFMGMIDDIRIYERPLSPKEVLLLANQTNKSPRPEGEIIINPRAGYRLNIANHKKLSSITNSIGQIRFSPDSKRLAAVTGNVDSKSGAIMVWNIADGKKVLATTRKSTCLSLDWKPDRNVIAVGREDGVVELIEILSGQPKVTYKVENIGKLRALSFNPSGNKLAVAGEGGRPGEKRIKIISISDSDNGDQKSSVLYGLTDSWIVKNGHDACVFHGVDWSGDGKVISAAGNGFKFKAWDAISGLPKHISDEYEFYFKVWGQVYRHRSRGVSFSPEGERLMGSSYQNIVIMNSLTGKKTHKILGHSGYVNSVAWSPNGKYVVSGGQGVCNDELATIWDAEKGVEILTFTGPKRDLPPIKKGSDHPISECVSVAWSPDGTKLAYAVKIHHRKSDKLKGNHISVNEQGEYATENYIQVWDFPNDNNTSSSSSNSRN